MFIQIEIINMALVLYYLSKLFLFHHMNTFLLMIITYVNIILSLKKEFDFHIDRHSLFYILNHFIAI